ncbi:deoxyhypusine hydroxylase-like protein [Chytriomyces sp. MP71]|nr:deoxyhypusine hydroxylase-like protein [Chytriomyces sp. MP71]
MVALAVEIPDAEYERLEAILTNTIVPPAPLKARFRALFTLKSVQSNRAVDIISKAFNDPSALLRHELAYVLGQMKNAHAIPVLNSVLADLKEDCMVRHEAAEALGAIGEERSIETLQPYLDPSVELVREVRETAELAIERIRYEASQRLRGLPVQGESVAYTSIDPAPALDDAELVPREETAGQKIKKLSTQEVGAILMDTTLPLFMRYKAMFALRNRGDMEAVLQLAKGFGDESALFRHEIAYVFGQMQHEASVPSLIKTLSNEGEQAMVRHEAAEALGSIATPECFEVLKKFKADGAQVVKESCVVGLDMAEFELSGDFQYAERVETV